MRKEIPIIIDVELKDTNPNHPLKGSDSMRLQIDESVQNTKKMDSEGEGGENKENNPSEKPRDHVLIDKILTPESKRNIAIESLRNAGIEEPDEDDITITIKDIENGAKDHNVSFADEALALHDLNSQIDQVLRDKIKTKTSPIHQMSDERTPGEQKSTIPATDNEQNSKEETPKTQTGGGTGGDRGGKEKPIPGSRWENRPEWIPRPRLTRERVHDIVENIYKEIFAGSSDDDIRLYKNERPRYDWRNLEDLALAHPDWREDQLIYETKNKILQRKANFEAFKRTLQKIPRTNIEEKVSKPNVTNAETITEKTYTSLDEIKREALRLAMKENGENMSMMDTHLQLIEEGRGMNKTFWDVLLTTVEHETAAKIRKLQEKAKAFEGEKQISQNVKEEGEFGDTHRIEEKEFTIEDYSLEELRREGVRLMLAQKRTKEEDIEESDIDVELEVVNKLCKGDNASFWLMIGSLSGAPRGYTAKIEALSREESNKKNLGTQNRSAAASVPLEFEGTEFEVQKKEHDPMRKFLKECGLKDEEIGDIEYRSAVRFIINRDGKKEPIFMYAHNLHDILETRAKTPSSDREVLDNLEIKNREDATDNKDKNETVLSWKGVAVFLDNNLMDEFEAGGKFEKHVKKLDQLLKKIKDDLLPDEYAQAFQAGKINSPRGAIKEPQPASQPKASKQRPIPGMPTPLPQPESSPKAEQEAQAENINTLSIDSAEIPESETETEAKAKTETEVIQAQVLESELELEHYEISASISESFKDKFNISAEELKSIKNFDTLTEGQQKLVLENLQQITLGRIREVTGEEYRKKTKNVKVLGMQGLGKLWHALSKNWQIANLQKKNAKSILGGGILTHEKVIEELVKGMRFLNFDVEEVDGKLEVGYVAEQDIIASGRRTLEDQDVSTLAEFNMTAREYSKMPAEWSVDSARFMDKYRNFPKVENAYRNAKEKLIDLRLAHNGHDSQEAALFVNKLEEKIRINQIFNAHPEAEKELDNIQDEAVWHRAFKSIGIERGSYFALGTVSRTVTFGLLGALSAPLAVVGGAALTGGIIGRFRAQKDLREQDYRRRRGEKNPINTKKLREDIKEVTNEIKKLESRMPTLSGNELIQCKADLISAQHELRNYEKQRKTAEHLDDSFVPVENLTNKLTKLTLATEVQQDENEKAQLLNQLKLRIEYTQAKLDESQVSYGKTGIATEAALRLSQQLNLVQALSQAQVLYVAESKRNKIDTDFLPTLNSKPVDGEVIPPITLNTKLVRERLDDFRHMQDKMHSQAVSSETWKRTRQAMYVSAGFGAAGAVLRDAITGEWFGWRKQHHDAGLHEQLNHKNSSGKVVENSPEIGKRNIASKPQALGSATETSKLLTEVPPYKPVPPPRVTTGSSVLESTKKTLSSATDYVKESVSKTLFGKPSNRPPLTTSPTLKLGPEFFGPSLKNSLGVIEDMSNLSGAPKILPSAEVIQYAQELDNLRNTSGQLYFKSSNVYEFRDGLYAAATRLKAIVDNFNRLSPIQQKEVMENMERMRDEIQANELSGRLDSQNKAYLDIIIDRSERIQNLYDKSKNLTLPKTQVDPTPRVDKAPLPDQASSGKQTNAPMASVEVKNIPKGGVPSAKEIAQSEIEGGLARTSVYTTAPSIRSGGTFEHATGPFAPNKSVYEIPQPQQTDSTPPVIEKAPQPPVKVLENAPGQPSAVEQLIAQRSPMLASQLRDLEHNIKGDPKTWSFERIDANLDFIKSDFHRLPLLAQENVMEHLKKLYDSVDYSRIGVGWNREDATHLDHSRELLREMKFFHKQTHEAFFREIAKHGFNEKAYMEKIVANHLTVRTILDVYEKNKAENIPSPFVTGLVEDKNWNLAGAPNKNMSVDEYMRGRFMASPNQIGLLGLGRRIIWGR